MKSLFVDHPASILSSDGYFNACTFYAIVARWLTLPKIGWWCWESVAIKNVLFATFSLQCFLQPSLKAFCFTLLPPVWLVLPKAEWDFSTKELQPFCCHTYCARSNLKKSFFCCSAPILRIFLSILALSLTSCFMSFFIRAAIQILPLFFLLVL